MKLVAAIAIVCGSGIAHADVDALAMLRDKKQVWTYEVVAGNSPDSLKPLKDAPTATCKISEVTQIEELTRSSIECRSDAPPPAGKMSWPGRIGDAVSQSYYLVFDDQGVRDATFEAGNAVALRKRWNLKNLVFPKALPKTLKISLVDDGGGKTTATVKETSMPVMGKTQKVWRADTKFVFPKSAKEAPTVGAAALLPGIGFALLCHHSVLNAKPAWACLRLTKVGTAP